MRIDINQLEFIDRKLRDMALWIEEKTGLELLSRAFTELMAEEFTAFYRCAVLI